TLSRPRRAARSPVKVAEPTAIHGSRQIGIAARIRGAGAGSRQADWASASQAGSGQPSATVNIRRSDAIASSSVLITVTQTVIPAARSRSTSTRRFSSWLARTMSGSRAAIAARSGFLVPRTRGTSRSAGWVHQIVAPASASGRVAATDSVSEGTREITRRAGRASSTGYPRSSRGSMWSLPGAGLDVAAVLAADFEEGLGYLLEAADAGGVHEGREGVAAGADRVLEGRQRCVGVLGVLFLELADGLELGFLLLLGRAGELEGGGRGVFAARVAERVDADEGQRAVVLALLVEHRLVLDAAPLVAGLHRPEHPAADADRLELGQHGLFDQVGQLVDDVRALERVLVHRQAPLLTDDHLDGERPADRLRAGGGDRLVVGVGVQAVAVVVDRAERLQGGADVIEVHLLGVQRPARGLHVVLQLLRPVVGAVAVAHGDRPDPPGDPAHHGVLGVHPVGEEERQVRREVVDAHAPGEVGLDVGKPVGQGERELADRVGPGLGDVVAGDRHRVEVADLVGDEPLLDVAHHPQAELGREDAGVLALVLLEDVGLDGAAD